MHNAGREKETPSLRDQKLQSDVPRLHRVPVAAPPSHRPLTTAAVCAKELAIYTL